MPGSKAAGRCRPPSDRGKSFIAPRDSTFAGLIKPASWEMDPIFNRLYRHGDGGALDALIHASAENAGLLVCPDCLRVFERHVLRIAAVPSQPPKELCLQRSHIDVRGRGR